MTIKDACEKMIVAKSSKNLLSSLDTKCKRLEPLLTPLKFKERCLRKNLQRLKTAVKGIASFAHQYDYQDIEANGFWSFIRLVDKFMTLVVDSFAEHNHRDYDPTLDAVSTGLVKYVGVVELMRKATATSTTDDNANMTGNNYENALKLKNGSVKINNSYEVTMACFRQFLDMKREQTIMHAYHPSFWLCKSSRKSQEGIALLISLFSNFPISLKVLWNPRYRGSMVSKCQMQADVNYPFAIWNLSDLELYKTIQRYSRQQKDRNLLVKDVLAERQVKYILPVDGGVIKVFKKTDNSNGIKSKSNEYSSASAAAGGDGVIKCRFLRDTSREKPSNCSIILHCHGGGLIAQTPESHEGYLRDWANKIGGIPILSVEYSLAKRYPTAYQELLDVYLWLASGSTSVARQVGFKPEKIVLVGDSAGGSLTTSLCFMLADIKDMVSKSRAEKAVLMPAALIGIVSGFRSTSTTPSKALLSMLDPVLSPGVILASLGTLATPSRAQEDSVSIFTLIDNPFLDIPLISSFSKIAVKICKDLLILGSVLRGLEGTMPWYRRHNYYVKGSMKTLEALIAQSPYLSPLANFKDFGALKATSLHLISTHYDPSLDDSVALAKSWLGPVTLEVYDELPHGFLYFTQLSKEAKVVSDNCAKRLKEACVGC